MSIGDTFNSRTFTASPRTLKQEDSGFTSGEEWPTLRICMVTGYRPTPGGGGMEKHVYELVCGLLERGVDVEIICEDRSFLPDEHTGLQDRIIGVPPDSIDTHGWVELYTEKSRRFAELLDPSRYDLVHCHSQYGYDVALKLATLAVRPALVNTFHLTPTGQLERYAELGIPEPEGAPIDRVVAGMEATAAQLADHNIAVSRAVGAELVRLYGVAEERVTPIYNWFDDRNFQPHGRELARNRLGLDPERQYLLYVGHFGLHRGRLLAEVMRQMDDDITLLAIHPEGDGEIAAEFEGRIQFPGYVPPERLALYYAASDLQCFPAVYSGFGLVLIEGMACGCPPVTFDLSAMNEIVTPESGYLVPEFTPDAYAAVLRDALRAPGEKRAGAMQRSREFRMGPQMDRVIELYREIVRR